jgi:hypothetical protein
VQRALLLHQRIDRRADRVAVGDVEDDAAAAREGASARRSPSAPAAVVAVPTTRKPFCASVVAIARPMPREAPVTRATWAATGWRIGAHASIARAVASEAGS